jgi:hypothetical protein
MYGGAGGAFIMSLILRIRGETESSVYITSLGVIAVLQDFA